MPCGTACPLAPSGTWTVLIVPSPVIVPSRPSLRTANQIRFPPSQVSQPTPGELLVSTPGTTQVVVRPARIRLMVVPSPYHVPPGPAVTPNGASPVSGGGSKARMQADVSGCVTTASAAVLPAPTSVLAAVTAARTATFMRVYICIPLWLSAVGSGRLRGMQSGDHAVGVVEHPQVAVRAADGWGVAADGELPLDGAGARVQFLDRAAGWDAALVVEGGVEGNPQGAAVRGHRRPQRALKRSA